MILDESFLFLILNQSIIVNFDSEEHIFPYCLMLESVFNLSNCDTIFLS